MTRDPERASATANASCNPSRTIALFSSSRRDGNTGRFIDCIALDLSIEVVDRGSRRISAYDYEHLNRQDDYEPLMAHVLKHDQIIFATPVYWYSVSPAMKIFLDRISDFLEVPELLPEGRRLRGKRAFVVCTSISEEPANPFLEAFKDTFQYLGMLFGGVAHANCQQGYMPGIHDQHALTMAILVRDAAQAPKKPFA